MKVVSAAPLLPRSSLSTWTMSFLAFAQRVLDAGAADVDAGLEVAAGDFLERQEPVALAAVVDEAASRLGSTRVMTPL